MVHRFPNLGKKINHSPSATKWYIGDSQYKQGMLKVLTTLVPWLNNVGPSVR